VVSFKENNMAKRKVILTSKAPQPRGPYSQGVIYNGILYISGQGPIDPVTNKLINGTIQQQALRTLENIKAIIVEAGGKLENILKITCYLENIDDFSVFNTTYKDYFIKEPPARTTVQASKLPGGMKIEMDAIVAL
jgi:2-iminobutanoate/2-iminopropanoate deaminase